MSDTKSRAHSVNLWSLVALIIGSTVGAGIFSLPQNIASVAAPGAMLIGWVIAGVGMLSVAFVFQILAHRKPHLDSGVYAYVRAGLGDFIGFAAGWGYWLGSVVAQVGYATLFFNTVGHYVPIFSADHQWTSAIAVSLLSWAIFAVLARGVRQASVMNFITTAAKLLPILAFIVLTAFVGFTWDKFTLDFWGDSTGLTVMQQVQGIMLFTVWVFIGVEGASVYSANARIRADVSRATIIGFFSVLVLLVAVSTLSYGVLTQEELANLPDNSMASVLEAVVGPWGGAFISFGLCLSVLGAYVSWQMLCAEPIVMMSVDELLPRAVGKTNAAGAPWVAQLISTATIQLFIIIFYLNETSYLVMVQLATIMYLLPYIFSALYLLLLAVRGQGLAHPHAGTKFDLSGPEVGAGENRRHLYIGVIAFIYSLWLIYAANPVYVLLGALAVLPGLLPYVGTRLAKKEKVFNAFEWFIVALVIVGSIAGLWGLKTGALTL
ncbi:lysine transporter [Corynebacterium phocae]|uniref:Lysine transporter n=1 Tax=Corynebacterium phocae TaxID=161895 RepID=A0A1L7D406_9CORY|nr:amino acid permease [Corynebacterium phocae]APT92869.1 lysine transporter [Corynebacterium phocae]KAA8723188.1 amino acid permease [Corynebacterium phocae]